MNTHAPLKTGGIIVTVLIGAGLRLLLVLYAASKESVRDQELGMTDIDYKVYSDAAACANPYLCHHTYRYSPLLAYLMVFNRNCEFAGKLFFILFDVAAMMGLATLTKPNYRNIIVKLYAYNPLFIYLTARGSCESISMALMFWTWWLIFENNGNAVLGNAFNKKVTVGPRPNRLLGFALYGLWVHFRVYPIIFLPILLLHELSLARRQNKSFWPSLCSLACFSGGVFLALLACFYWKYGQAFLEQTYLYHLKRLDNRHSFSPIFYEIYLTMSSQSAIRSLAQLCGLIAVIRRVHSTISPAYGVFLATYIFVNFNKVITLQYYMWMWGALLLVLPESSLLTNSSRRLQKSFNLSIQWVLGILVWVWMSLRLERDGENLFKGMWIVCICKLFLDLWVLSGFMQTIQNKHLYSPLPSDPSDPPGSPSD